jgi:hypothetical protein
MLGRVDFMLILDVDIFISHIIFLMMDYTGWSGSEASKMKKPML